MLAKHSVRLAVALTAAILLGGMAYLGYRLIQDVHHNTENMAQHTVSTSSNTHNSSTLAAEQQINMAVSAASLTVLVQAEQGVSNGQDLLIKAGEFAYRNGEPHIRLSLLNQGNFAAGGVFVGFKLYLDGGNEPVAPMTVVEAQFAENLLSGSNTLAHFVITDPRWQSKAVRAAKSRRVVAQIVAVGDSERGGADYPQMSAGVLLRQTANDWSKKISVLEAEGVSLRESASQVNVVSPNIEVQADVADAHQPQMLPEKAMQNPNDIAEFLEKPLPTGEPRIISVQVQEYKDGQLQRSETKE